MRLRRAVGRDVGIDRGRHQRVGADPDSDMRSASRSSRTTLRASSCSRRCPCRRGRQRRAQRPTAAPGCPTARSNATPPAFGAVQVQADLRELPLIAAAAIVDGEAAVGDADLVQRLAVEAAGRAAVEPELAELVDPGEQRGDIGGDAALGHRLQRETRIVLRRLDRRPPVAPEPAAAGGGPAQLRLDLSGAMVERTAARRRPSR